ncbi:MAG: imidazoleglycerol-phosphate dehydratase HisB [Elusimicrobiota bacterium]|jgi:imidazoleglycerol-phosphate dehydratase|nr:imidazoleglycerol-phosphate dehydratase HisB [Elusimicrobiota bacterium]
MYRCCEINRKTNETNIFIKLDLDGIGNSKISTTIPFLDHMLSHISKHGKFDIILSASGDTHIDEHHLIEDIGITIGQAIDKCLVDKKGIERFGFSSLPMDETLVECSLDISGRPFLVYNMDIYKQYLNCENNISVKILKKIQEFSKEKEKYELYKHFFYSLSYNCGLTLHFNLKYGENLHHNLEATFKAFGQALKKAVIINKKYENDLPSTKGII